MDRAKKQKAANSTCKQTILFSFYLLTEQNMYFSLIVGRFANVCFELTKQNVYMIKQFNCCSSKSEFFEYARIMSTSFGRMESCENTFFSAKNIFGDKSNDTIIELSVTLYIYRNCFVFSSKCTFGLPFKKCQTWLSFN